MTFSWPGYSSKADPLPRTIRFCKVCQKETQHEVRTGAGVVAKMCVDCLYALLNFKGD